MSVLGGLWRLESWDVGVAPEYCTYMDTFGLMAGSARDLSQLEWDLPMSDIAKLVTAHQHQGEPKEQEQSKRR